MSSTIATVSASPVNQIQQILTAPFWTPIGVIFSSLFVIVGGSFSLYKYLKSRQHKEISYSIVTDTLLANIQDGMVGTTDIKVMVEGKKVQNVRFVALRIRNSGNVPIKQEDYEVPLWFMEGSLLRSRNLIDGKVYNTEPANIPAVATLHSDIDKAGINKLLLNSGDAIYINLLLSDYSQPIQVNGRIVGVKEIKQEPFNIKQSLNLTQRIGQLIAVFIVLGIISVIPSISLSLFLHAQFWSNFVIITLTFSVVFLCLYLFNKIKQKFRG